MIYYHNTDYKTVMDGKTKGRKINFLPFLEDIKCVIKHFTNTSDLTLK